MSLLGSVGSVFTAGLTSSLGGVVAPPAPKTAISGGGAFSPGGITIGSKVVGSGSAATTVPPLAGASSGSITTQAGTPASLAATQSLLTPLAIIAGVLVLVGLLLFAPKRGRKPPSRK